MILQFLTGLNCQVLNTTGIPGEVTPGNGWKLYTYQGGTFDVNLPTYSDSAGMSENANPVVFDPSGQASIALLPQAYNFILTDENDVTQETIENFVLGGTGGASVTVASTVSDMRNIQAGTASLVITQGYETATDGCGQIYGYDPNNGRADDGFFVFAPTSAPTLGRYLTRFVTPNMKMAGDSGALVSSFDTITRAILAIGSSLTFTTDLLFGPGTYVNSNTMLSFADTNVLMETGSFLTTSGSGAFDFPHGFEAPVIQVFSGTQAVTFSSAVPYAYAEWFGAQGDGATDNLAFIQKLLLATGNGSNPNIPLMFPGNDVYLVSGNPHFSSFITKIYAKNPVANSGDSTIYVNAGITLSSGADTYLKAGRLSIYGDGRVGGTLTIGNLDLIGNFAVGGSLTASGNITSTAGDISAYGNIQAGTGPIGYLKYRVGASSVYGVASGPNYKRLTPVSNSGSGDTTLASKGYDQDAFFAVGDEIRIYAEGVTAANTNNKTLKLVFDNGASVVTLINVPLTFSTPRAYRWDLSARVIRSGSGTFYVIASGHCFDASSGELMSFIDPTYTTNVTVEVISPYTLTSTDHTNTPLLPLTKTETFSFRTNASVSTTVTLAFTVSCIGTGISSNDITLNFFETRSDPTPPTVN